MIGAFCNTILLGTHLDNVLVLNTTLDGELKHGFAHVLLSFVVSQDFDVPFSLILCKCLELLECIKNI